MNITKDNAVRRRKAEILNRGEEGHLADHIPKSEIIIIARIAPRVALNTTIKEPIIIPNNEIYFEWK